MCFVICREPNYEDGKQVPGCQCLGHRRGVWLKVVGGLEILVLFFLFACQLDTAGVIWGVELLLKKKCLHHMTSLGLTVVRWNKPFPPQTAFGHGFIAVIGTPTKTLSFFLFWNRVSYHVVLASLDSYSVACLRLPSQVLEFTSVGTH